jgi:hypothetical protein
MIQIYLKTKQQLTEINQLSSSGVMEHSHWTIYLLSADTNTLFQIQIDFPMPTAICPRLVWNRHSTELVREHGI